MEMAEKNGIRLYSNLTKEQWRALVDHLATQVITHEFDRGQENWVKVYNPTAAQVNKIAKVLA